MYISICLCIYLYVYVFIHTHMSFRQCYGWEDHSKDGHAAVFTDDTLAPTKVRPCSLGFSEVLTVTHTYAYIYICTQISPSRFIS